MMLVGDEVSTAHLAAIVVASVSVEAVGVTVFSKVTNLTDEVYAHSVLPDGYRVGAPRIWSVGMSFDF